MKLVEFLTKTIEGELSEDEQLKYLSSREIEDAQEIAEAVELLLSHMPDTPKLPGAIDVAGTGGSGLDTINSSTISAFVLAGAGVKVAKHGNNSASGKFGSFDLLDALGVPISLSPQELQMRYNELGLAFLYAKSFHPVMRHFAGVRKAIGKPTFFNFLGPLLSPVGAERQVIGIFDESKMRLVAEVAQQLGKKHVLVVHGSDGLDEITVTGPTKVVELKDGEISEFEISPSTFGIDKTFSADDIKGGDGPRNIEAASQLISGSGSEGHKALIIANTAAAMYVSGKAQSLEAAGTLARKAVQSGEAQKILEEYKKPSVLKVIADERRKDVTFTSDGSSKKDTRTYNGGLIAEIKKASPSEGTIVDSVEVAEQAKMYEANGAQAISIVTEPLHFGGDLLDVARVKEVTESVPILAKDFVTDESQINAIAEAGADIILLIAAILSADDFKKFYDHAKSLGLEVLAEVHSKDELEIVLESDASLVGINARNLHDFSINPELFSELQSLAPKDTRLVAESGIRSYQDIPEGSFGHLVGTIIMKHPYPELKVKELSGQPLLKLCGIRSVEAAELCEANNVDLIGINFVGRSKRKVTIEQAKPIAAACTNTKVVGIFEGHAPEEVKKIVKEVGLDAIQIAPTDNPEDFVGIAPLIQSRTLDQQKHRKAFLSIVDNKLGGSGQKIDTSKLQTHEPSLIAGGVDLETAKKLLNDIKPLGIDTASGIESNGEQDLEKIKAFANLFNNARY